MGIRHIFGFVLKDLSPIKLLMMVSLNFGKVNDLSLPYLELRQYALKAKMSMLSFYNNRLSSSGSHNRIPSCQLDRYLTSLHYNGWFHLLLSCVSMLLIIKASLLSFHLSTMARSQFLFIKLSFLGFGFVTSFGLDLLLLFNVPHM